MEVPTALRVGTPVLDHGRNAFQSYPSDSRRASTVSNLDRYASPVYDISYASPPPPSLPPLPTFSGSTSYTPLENPFEPQGTHLQLKPARKHSLLSKFGSIRSNRLSGSRYSTIQADEEQNIPREARHKRLKSLDEDVDEDIGFDLSSFESPIALHDFGKKPDASTELRELGLGGGMISVLSASLNPKGHQRSISVTDHKTRDAAYKVAQKRGEILALEEYPDPFLEDKITDTASLTDIGSAGGSEYIRRNTRATIVGTGEAKKSYFFPKDPEQPAWRPFSMRKSYISLLVIIAITFGVLQEFLCQVSIRKEQHDDGLLKFTHPQELSMMQYFAWKYMPTIVLLAYGIMWQIVDFEVKRLEPYYQLSRQDGATARDSLNQDYLTFLSYLVPLKAIRSKQWAVVYSSVATLTAGGLVPVLQSASLVMEPDKDKREDDKPKFVRIDPIWSRLMTASLGFIAILGILLLISLRRKSGLLSDPKGIAGIASMATKSHILNDFKGLDTAPNTVIHEQLRTRRYNLHKSSLWQGEYIREEEKVKNAKAEHPHPILLRLGAGIPFIIYMMAFACFVPILMFVRGANVISEKIPWLLTALATIVKLLWNCLDMNLRVIEPYYILSRRNAPPKTLTMDYSGTIPGWLSVKAAMEKQYLVSLVGGGSILVEILTVCVTSFSVDGRKFISGQGGSQNDSNPDDRYNTAETFRSFWISFALATLILIYLCIVAAVVYSKRRHKFLPRQPGTIAGVLAFIHQSRMLDDFIDTERMNSKEMTAHLEDLHKTYALGWFNGRDGEDHCGVDQEPISAPYVHGEDWRKSRLTSIASTTWEHY